VGTIGEKRFDMWASQDVLTKDESSRFSASERTDRLILYSHFPSKDINSWIKLEVSIEDQPCRCS
jgi:hypothetical protein